MILRLLPALALTVWGYGASAQQQPISQAGIAGQANLDALAAGSPTILPRGGAEGTKGSPYADNRWLPAHITLSSKLALAPVPLKYDVLNQRLLMRPLKQPTDSLLLDDRLVTRFELEDPTLGAGVKRRVFRRFTEASEPSQRLAYVEVLHEGRYLLLKYYKKVLRKASYSGAYTSGERYDELEDKSVYYLRQPAGNLVPVKLSIKALQMAAPDLAPALKESAAAKAAKSDAEWSAVLNTLDAR